MEIINIHQQAEISGIQAAAFGFEMNAKMYDILISKMYTNKPGAVIRELSANAWDAHKDAGKEDVPFEIQLPTWLDKTFSIRDYGTGIPHDRFEHIYTNVGSSTKEGTNEFIGGFGLGSKTPFTMTDTFMVENWNAGIKTTWVCFKDKGVPQVSKINEETSSEPSGLKVSFSFDSNEVPEFTKQVSKQLQFFPLKPVITGGEGNISFIPLPIGWETKDYFYRNSKDSRGYIDRGSYVVMGNVAYELTSSYFDYQYRNVFDSGLIIKVPIGAVDIPPSRENLEMTPRTIAAIIKILDVIKTDYEKDTKAKLDACTNVLEARKLAVDLNTNLLSRPFKENYQFKNIPFSQLSNGYIERIAGYSLYGFTRSWRSKRTSYCMQNTSPRALVDDKLLLYVNDLGQGYKKHLEDNCDKITATVSSTMSLVIVQPPPHDKADYDTVIAKMIADVTEEYGKAPLLISSIIGHVPAKVKAPKGTVVRTEPKQVFKVSGNPDASESLLKQCTEVTGDLPTDGYYLPLNGATVDVDVANFRSLIEKGLLGELKKPLYLVRMKTVPKVTKLTLLTQAIVDTLVEDLVARAKYQDTVNVVAAQVRPPSTEFLPMLTKLTNKEIQAYIRYSTYIHKKLRGLGDDVRALAKQMCPKYSAELWNARHKGIVTKPKLHKWTEAYADVNEFLTHIGSTYSSDRRDRRMKVLKMLTSSN